MSFHLCITVRWFDGRYHGLLGRDGPAEWPPSPLRIFQAMVAGMARYEILNSTLVKAAEWLESQLPPMLITPQAMDGNPTIRYVPNNDGDKQFDRQNRLTPKVMYPTIMDGPPEVHYLWLNLNDDLVSLMPEVMRMVRYVTCVGWGIDMAYADARMLNDAQLEELQGIRWRPVQNIWRNEGMLRVPVAGSLKSLRQAHEAKQSRIRPDDAPLRMAQKSVAFNRVFYTSITQPLGRPFACFTLHHPQTDGFYRYPQEKLIHLAGMLRHMAIKLMKQDPPDNIATENLEDWVNRFVAGHRDPKSSEHMQFSYAPLPSIGHEHTDPAVRRIMIVAPMGCDAELQHLAEKLDGIQLRCENDPEDKPTGPVLRLPRYNDGVVKQYTQKSEKLSAEEREQAKYWNTVTPVILPGYNDHQEAKTERLIRKALRQSGIDQECTFEWSALPNFNGCLSAYKYDHKKRPTGYYRPDHLQGFTAVHLRIRFTEPFAGPLVIGSGRHCGLGVCAMRLRS